MKLIAKLILPFLLFTLISNPTFATASHEGKDSREIAFSARKLGLKTKEGIAKLARIKQSKNASKGLSGAAKHDLYKKQLRSSMPRPKVKNEKLNE